MTTKPVFLLLSFCVLLFSCQQDESEDSTTPSANPTNTSVFPPQPVQVSNKDIRLSYIGKTQTDSSNFYQVIGLYEGQPIGFNLSLPRGEQASAHFTTRGKVSDAFLRMLQKIYQQPVDSTARLSDYVSPDYFNLAEVYKADSGLAPGAQSRLLFRDAADNNNKPELLLNVNEKEHWVELVEKDTLHRAGLLRLLTRK